MSLSQFGSLSLFLHLPGSHPTHGAELRAIYTSQLDGSPCSGPLHQLPARSCPGSAPTPGKKRRGPASVWTLDLYLGGQVPWGLVSHQTLRSSLQCPCPEPDPPGGWAKQKAGTGRRGADGQLASQSAQRPSGVMGEHCAGGGVTGSDYPIDSGRNSWLL